MFITHNYPTDRELSGGNDLSGLLFKKNFVERILQEDALRECKT